MPFCRALASELVQRQINGSLPRPDSNASFQLILQRVHDPLPHLPLSNDESGGKNKVLLFAE